MVKADEIKANQRAAWAGLSAGWEKWDSIIMSQLAPVTAAMVECLGIREAQHHLDVAAGTGEPGLTIAQLAPRGHVVLTDLSPEMLDIAVRRAAARGITNVETRVGSADDLPFEDAAFDSVSVRFGYMFLPDLVAATAEFVRVLRPGGRLCASVWVKPEANPWTSVVMDAIAAETDLSPSDPNGPGMFRCAAPHAIASLYETAGLTDVAEHDIPVDLVTRSATEYWDMISEHVSLAAAALRHVDERVRSRVAAAVIANVSGYARANGTVTVPGLARVIAGAKP